MEGWVDADLAGCLDSRCSTRGYIFKVSDSIVDWQSKRQATTASPSTLESEYVAMSEAAKHGVYLQRLLEELGYKSDKVPLNCDTMGAISLANNPSFHSRIAHRTKSHNIYQLQFTLLFICNIIDEHKQILAKYCHTHLIYGPNTPF